MSSKTPSIQLECFMILCTKKTVPKKYVESNGNIKDDVVIICQIKKENKNPAHDEKKRDY